MRVQRDAGSLASKDNGFHGPSRWLALCIGAMAVTAGHGAAHARRGRRRRWLQHGPSCATAATSASGVLGRRPRRSLAALCADRQDERAPSSSSG